MCNKEIWRPHTAPLSPIPTNLQPGGRLAHKVAAVLFDVYGTLFISSSGEIGSDEKVFEQFGAQLAQLLQKYDIDRKPADLKRALNDTILRRHRSSRAAGVAYPEVAIDRIWMQVLEWDDIDRVRAFAIEYELIVNPVYPMPNVDQTLAHCRAVPVHMGIISNAQFYTPCLFEWFLGAELEALGFAPEFLIFSYRTGHAKPSPHLFQLARAALKAHDIQPHDVLFVGNDMLNDVYSARQAGFQTALFAGDQRSLRLREDTNQCQNLTPDVIITDLLQLCDHII